MEVENDAGNLDVSTLLATLLDEFSAVADYRTLRDTLPHQLASLLHCRCVLLYQHMGETLQFASGSFANWPGWSSTLLAVAHINPIEVQGELPEARAWRTRRASVFEQGGAERALVCAPLIYRQHAIGVLSALRGLPGETGAELYEPNWSPTEVPLVAVVANVVAMLLENTRLLERDRERIHELSLLNGITSQMNCSLHERSRVQRIVLQRAREISNADLCDVLIADSPAQPPNWLAPELHAELLQRWQSAGQDTPLVLERTGEARSEDLLAALSTQIKTFFAIPLSGNPDQLRSRANGSALTRQIPRTGEEPGARVFGVLVGAYHKPWKLRRETLALLQILANQASAVLENIALMEEVVEARNEARRLLRQVLDDQRLKELILESIPSGLITIDMQGRITTFNRAAETVLGYHPREVLGQSAYKILALRDLERVLHNGQPQHENLLTSGRQGQEVALDVTLAPLHDERGQQMGVLATFTDVTSMRHLEEEKRRLDRLASLGKMSASVAHEVRNPLAAIKTSMQMLLDDLEHNPALQPDEDTREAALVVLEEVERLDSIVRDLLLFARPRHLHLVECDLLAMCERILHFLQPQCTEHGVRVHLIHQETPLVHVDAAQMEQVLMNLFLNALQAMPDGGILTISCQLIRLPGVSNDVRRSPEGRPPATPLLEFARVLLAEEELVTENEQSNVCVSEPEQQNFMEINVSDTGSGIAQEDLERIFQPFYTTKAHGIGLGLPITHRLIEDHGGSILVESQLGYGTTISVRLPVNEKEASGRTLLP